ncbi:hypothetical protein Golob_018320, partial [Gossypium lobatum]|nr:hypothetical protein [Gossypium lobatum]
MTVQESALKLYPTLCEVEDLTEDFQTIQRKCSFSLVHLLLYNWN